MRVVVINASRVDFDRTIDWSSLGVESKVFYDSIGENPSDDEILSRCQNCDVVVSKEIAISAQLINRLPTDVKLICEAGTGYNNINLDACRSRGILVANVPSYSEQAVATLVITFLLNFSCGLLEQQRELWEGNRHRFTQGLPSRVHFELTGKTLGLIGGRGNIGTKVANTALSLGMHVLISSRSLPEITQRSTEEPIEYTDSVDDLLRRSDFVSLHCPLNSETRHLINATSLSLMKPTAYIINTARGAIIDEDALIHALQNNLIAGAALDVQTVEPPPSDSLLYTLANCILTPHVGWKRAETRQRIVKEVANNIAKFVEGNTVNIVS